MKKAIVCRVDVTALALVTITLLIAGFPPSGSGGERPESSWQVVGKAGCNVCEGEYTSLAIDSTGIPYVAYKDGGNSNKATVMRFK